MQTVWRVFLMLQGAGRKAGLPSQRISTVIEQVVRPPAARQR